MPEQAQSYWVRNINNPSLTVFLPPKEKATGAAIIVVPGGGHRELVFNAEGRQPAIFLSNLGIAAFALKYRLGREPGSPYTIDDARRIPSVPCGSSGAAPPNGTSIPTASESSAFPPAANSSR